VKLVLRAPTGAEKVVEVMGPRQTFGEAVMFLGKPYLVDAQTLADSKLIFVPSETVFQALDAEPAFARRLLAALSARLHRLIKDVEGYSLHTGRERVIGYLLSGLPDADAANQAMTLLTRKGVIASRLSLTPEHFSRILHELSTEGLITVSGQTITIPDIARLRAHAATATA
jgi:CRP-like cAMP-binding protein